MQTNNQKENNQNENDQYPPQREQNNIKEQQPPIHSGPQTTQQELGQNNLYIPPPIMKIPIDSAIMDENVPIMEEEIVVKVAHKPQPMLGPFDRHSMRIKCERCNLVVESKIQKLPGPGAITCSCILCMMCLWPLGICCIPYYAEKCRDVYHHCPQCEELIGLKLYMVNTN